MVAAETFATGKSPAMAGFIAADSRRRTLEARIVVGGEAPSKRKKIAGVRRAIDLVDAALGRVSGGDGGDVGIDPKKRAKLDKREGGRPIDQKANTEPLSEENLKRFNKKQKRLLLKSLRDEKKFKKYKERAGE